MDTIDVKELLFFDTFSHDASEEINLDLVQFPKPVVISEIRIIPLGARVQADFPGGVRLGATNPSQFHIEFFVNDLSKNGASTFENLGGLEYRQTSDIQFECSQKIIPTDGLVLRGWYTTITLAVYGTLSKGVPPPAPDPRGGEMSSRAATAEWVQSQQATMYLDPGYMYPGDFNPAPPEHQYVDTWPTTPAAAPAAMVHEEPYDGKEYTTPPNWEPPPEETKSWPSSKKDRKSVSPIRGSGDKSRHRGEYWDEREERKDRRRREDEGKRIKEGSGKDEERRRDRDRSPSWRDSATRITKSGRENSWERERDKSPFSETGSFRRRPKSPPSRCPKRPYTPTERFWSPDRNVSRYSDELRRVSPSQRTASPSKSRVSEQLRVEVTGSPQTPLQSPAGVIRTAQDDRSLDEEQFEPILSDEDIVDESDSQFPELDYDFPDDLEDVVKTFNPFTFQVQKLENMTDPGLISSDIRGDAKSAALEEIEEILMNTGIEIKEDWVICAERLQRCLCAIPADSNLTPALLKWVQFGLELDQALGHNAPGVKLRHIKAGVRLAETLCHCGLAAELVRGGLHQQLLRLFQREHMALSIRLLILQAVSASLLHPEVMDSFLTVKWELEVDGVKETGNAYEQILRLLSTKLQVRIKFALNSLLEMVHTHEVLERLCSLTKKLINDGSIDDIEIIHCLHAVHRVFMHAGYTLSQPTRFLPVITQFDVRIDSKMSYSFIYRYFRHHKLLETLLVLLTNRASGQIIPAAVYDLLRSIADCQEGLIFLSSNTSVTSAILKALQVAEEYMESTFNLSLSMELPFRLHVLQNLDKLHSLQEEGDVFNILHELFCLSFSPVGKLQLAFVLSLEDNLQLLLGMAECFNSKSATRLYVCDLAAFVLRYSDRVEYLRTVGKTLQDLATREQQSKLHEVASWTLPGDLSLDDVTGLCEILKKHSTSESPVPIVGEVVTALRCLRHLCLPPQTMLNFDVGDDHPGFKELRYKHAALQLYSLDGLSYITSILTKVVENYEQPFIQSSSLLGAQGFTVVSLVEPAVILMRRMISYLIESRGADYKDLTHVNLLLDLYALMQAVPSNAEANGNAQNVCHHIVETLLAYTQPSVQGDAYGKSLWSLMLSDIFKFVVKAPYCFIPGFSLLSELLPLPLPVQTRTLIPPSEVAALRVCRQLWSAHVHPLAGMLHDLIAALACGSFAPLMQLVRRVAVQLADLAAPTALILARAILDPLLATLTRSDGGWDLPVSAHAARLLHFLVCLVPHHAFKVAVLSLITPGANARTDERLVTLVEAWCCILRTPGTTVSHGQAQEYVVLLLQTLLDPEISLVPANGATAGLANALPSRDILVNIIAALLDHIAAPDHPLPVLLMALKPLIFLTDHDYGFYHLRVCLDSRRDVIWKCLSRLSGELSRENTDALNAVHGTLALFREFVLDAPTPMRTSTMSAAELARVVRWEHTAEGSSLHPLLQIHSSLKEWSSTDAALSNLCESAGDLVKLLSKSDMDSVSELPKDEPGLPPALPLIEQFAARPVFVLGDPELKTLSSAYWLSLPSQEDVEQDPDQVQCDLVELSRSLLPDLHLPQEVQRICRLKPTDEDDDGKKQDTGKYQLSGARTRLPFVAPMRGRGGRPAPQRGDLFRSRPPNTSRPPSLHVDDFVALETCGQQPTGPTGYNKVSVRNVKEVIATRARGRGRVFGAVPYPRRDSPRGNSRGRGGWIHEELRLQPTSRFRTWPTEDFRRIHPFPR